MAKKSFKKFAGTGKLKAVIDSRRQHQKSRKLIDGREKRKEGKKRAQVARAPGSGPAGEEDDQEAEGSDEETSGKAPETVDDLLGAAFMEDGANSDNGAAPAGEADEDDDDDASIADTDDSFGDLDDIEANEAEMKKYLSNLAETDPDFHKYLKENDQEALDFADEASASAPAAPAPKGKKAKAAAAAAEKSKKGKKAAVVEDDGDEMEEYEAPPSDDEEDEPDFDGKGKKGKGREVDAKEVTMEMLKGWQKNLLESQSLRALRRLHLAFRALSHSSLDAESPAAQTLAYTINSPQIFSKLLLTTLKYTPFVLQAHVPFRLSPSTGRYKLLKSPPEALMKLIIGYMGNVMRLMGELPDGGEKEGALLRMCIVESSKMVPWIIGARKTVRAYLKTLLEHWSSGSDGVRIACFLAIRKIASAGDEGVKDMVLKGLYLTLLRTCKQSTVHTLPAINLMKNSASEVYTLDHATAYQHAFGYIRQLAIHLRNSMRVKTKDSYKAVYNWQFVHCIDFWSLVLSTACSREAQLARGGVESELQPLIYPLVQVTLGVIRLIPTSRYFPLRFHLLRSLLRLSAHTDTYIPLAPSLLEPLSSAEFTHKSKPSTLAPLDFEYQIRAPAQYPRTRVYQEGLAEEIAYLLLESQSLLSTSIAYPEMAIPITTLLRRFVKRGNTNKASSSKVSSAFKVLIDKIEANVKWVSEKRKGVEFAPSDRAGVEGFLQGVEVEKTPLGAFFKLQKKVRDAKRREIEKAAREERGKEEEDNDEEMGSSAGEEEDEEEDEDEDEMEFEDDE